MRSASAIERHSKGAASIRVQDGSILRACDSVT
jgi:hypothetical protein